MSEFTNKPKREQATVFRKAAVLIEGQPYLPKLRYKDPGTGYFCALGALAVANGDTVNFAPVNTPTGRAGGEFFGPAPLEYLSDHGGTTDCGTSFENFNNKNDTTKETVATAFRQIARAIEHGGRFGV